MLRCFHFTRSSRFSAWWGIFLLGLGIFGLQAQTVGTPLTKTPPLYLTLVEKTHDLRSYVEVLSDTTGELTITQVTGASFTNRFLPFSKLEAMEKYLWVRLTLINDFDQETRWLLETWNWDVATLYVPDDRGSYREKKTGLALPLREWDVKKTHRSRTLLSFRIPRKSRLTLYLHLENFRAAPPRLELTLLRASYFIEWDRNMRYAQGIFLGVLLVIALHHLFAFLSFRDRSYVEFVLYLISTGLYWMIYHGYALEMFWPDAPRWNVLSGTIFYALMVGSFLQFTRTYLQVGENFPRWDRALLWSMGGVLLLMVLQLLFGRMVDFIQVLLLTATLLIVVLSFIITVFTLQKQDRPAYYYLWANIFLVLGVLTYSFGEMQILSEGVLTIHGIQIGTALQAILFSFGLADRVNRMRRELMEKELERERLLREHEQKVAEELRRIDRMKDEFLATTSHELRTPLNGIIGIAESLLEGAAGKLSRKMRSNLSMIVSSGKRLAALVDDILDFSRLKTRSIVLHCKPVDMRTLTDVVLRLTQPLIAGKKLVLKNEIGRDIPPVYGDENRLQQIMHNLMGNAVKFTESGSVTVRAQVVENMVAISVSDTGRGIPPEKREAIFHAFAQADASASREAGGMGLGLSITKQLVELHGGRITVESQVGRGSTFTFTVPVARELPEPVTEMEEVARVQEAEVAEGVSPNGDTPRLEGEFRILIVDDEPINLQVLTNHLAGANYKIFQAASGEEALQLIQEGHRFDLVLLDIMMPRISGYEVCQKIRKQYLPSELPIIMLTAKNQVSDLVEGLAVGANDYIPKPFSRSELLARVKTHLTLKSINAAYARFVPHEFLRTLGRESIVEVKLGDQVQGEMTVLFSDIRSFTSLVEGMTPEQSFNFLNEYLRYVIPAIRNHRGFIDKYIGDAIMAMFPHRAEDALEAAIEAVQQVEAYNRIRRRRGDTPIEIGIGLHTGMLMLGTIGDEERMDGTVISDAVNLASRLEGLTKIYGATIVISQSTLSSIPYPEKYHLRFLGRVQVKGKKDPVGVYEVYDGQPEALIELRMKTREDFEKGLEYYFDREFAEAVLCFKRVLNIDP
ncbi:MAG: response regulator, partial [Calditrichaeota bacterium]